MFEQLELSLKTVCPELFTHGGQLPPPPRMPLSLIVQTKIKIMIKVTLGEMQ